jgi:hypothetical protein
VQEYVNSRDPAEFPGSEHRNHYPFSEGFGLRFVTLL